MCHTSVATFTSEAGRFCSACNGIQEHYEEEPFMERGTSKAQFRMIARSVGYRLGKAAAVRQQRDKSGQIAGLDFTALFVDEYVPDASTGYDEGLAFVKIQFSTGRTEDTFYQEKIHP
jgi:hypothetical protein